MISSANSAINRVYLHSAIQAFAETGGAVFFLVLLIKSGLSVPITLCAMAALLLGRFVLRPLVLPIARRIGLRRALMLGTVLESGTYWLTPHVAGIGAMLAAVIVLGSISSVLYWTSYHAYVAATGSAEQRGSQVGTIEAVNAVVAAFAPGIVALLIVQSGPVWGYAAVAMVQIAAALPLIGAREVSIPLEANEGRAMRRFGALVYALDGSAVAFTHYLWLIALFVTLDQGFGAYGAAMTLAGLAGAAMSLAAGRLIDLGHGVRSVWIGYGLAMLAAIAKGLSVETPWAAAAAAAFGAIAASVQIPVMMARIYALAKESGCTLRFHMATEAGWDLGCAAGCLIAAGLVSLGAPLGAPIFLAVASLAWVSVLLRRSYARADST